MVSLCSVMITSNLWLLIVTKYHLLHCLLVLYQCGPRLFLCMPKFALDVSIYMQQTTSADDIFRWIFSK